MIATNPYESYYEQFVKRWDDDTSDKITGNLSSCIRLDNLDTSNQNIISNGVSIKEHTIDLEGNRYDKMYPKEEIKKELNCNDAKIEENKNKLTSPSFDKLKMLI